MPLKWVAADEVYGSSGDRRRACRKAGLASVFIIPRDFPVTTAAGTVIRAGQAVAGAVFERRSCGMGSKGPRLSDWALAATADPREFLLIRRLISRPEQTAFYLCYPPEARPATITHSIPTPPPTSPTQQTFKPPNPHP